jgi:two-component system chemotaxis response regulator CheB
MRILIVDDSALMRRALGEILKGLPQAEIETARNGEEALRVIPGFEPDVVTLDVNMPVMDGLTCLSHIMAEHPRPVVMVSSITAEDSVPALEALAMGAVDVIEKPGGTISRRLDEIGDAVRATVRGAARARLRPARMRPRPVRQDPRPAPSMPPGPPAGAERVVVVGVSTGGPAALEQLVPELPEAVSAPVVIAQHMPSTFTRSLAERLDRRSAVRVVEADRSTPLEPGRVAVIRGGGDAVFERRLGRAVLSPRPPAPDAAWHPSVDRLVRSALEVFVPEAILGVLLTGMGDDGAAAMTTLHDRGGWTVAEAESSAVVFGMPRALAARGGAGEVVDLSRVGERIRAWCDRRRR